VETPPPDSGAPPASPKPQGFGHLVVPLFLTPFAVIGALLLLGLGFFFVLTPRERTADEVLERVLRGGANERWQAAQELAHRVSDPSEREKLDPGFPARVRAALEKSREDEPRVREFLVGTLAFLRDPASVDLLARLLEDPGEDPEGRIRWACAMAFGPLGDPSAVPLLERTLRESPDEGLRIACTHSLGRLPGEASVAALREALADEAWLVRCNASIALTFHGLDDGKEYLLELLEREKLRSLREGAFRREEDQEKAVVEGVRALASIGAREAIPRLERLAEEDPNPRVQDAALRALEELRRETPR
jgi:HEAT repeat protein